MFDKLVARCDTMLDRLGDFFAYTVKIPDSGTLTIDDAVQRLESVSGTAQGPGEPHSSGGISLYRVAIGTVTLD